MKVYLVSLDTIEDFPPVAIFRSKERAIECASKVGKSSGEGAMVLEFELDQENEDPWTHRWDARVHHVNCRGETL